MNSCNSYKSNNTASLIEKMSLQSALEFCRRKVVQNSGNQPITPSVLSKQISLKGKDGTVQTMSTRNYLFEISLKPLFRSMGKELKTLSAADNIFQMILYPEIIFNKIIELLE